MATFRHCAHCGNTEKGTLIYKCPDCGTIYCETCSNGFFKKNALSAGALLAATRRIWGPLSLRWGLRGGDTLEDVIVRLGITRRIRRRQSEGVARTVLAEAERPAEVRQPRGVVVRFPLGHRDRCSKLGEDR